MLRQPWKACFHRERVDDDDKEEPTGTSVRASRTGVGAFKEPSIGCKAPTVRFISDVFPSRHRRRLRLQQTHPPSPSCRVVYSRLRSVQASPSVPVLQHRSLRTLQTRRWIRGLLDPSPARLFPGEAEAETVLSQVRPWPSTVDLPSRTHRRRSRKAAMSAETDCQHSFTMIKSDTTLILWHCGMCHSGPHWFIFECTYCKLKTCRQCASNT